MTVLTPEGAGLGPASSGAYNAPAMRTRSGRLWATLLSVLASARVSSAQVATFGPEFRVNTFTTAHQDSASVASDFDGNFVIAWAGAAAQDGSDSGVFARRYDARGAALNGTEFLVNAYTTSFQWSPHVAAAADGEFLVAWEAHNHQSDAIGVFGRRYTASGAPGPEVLVNSPDAYNQAEPSSAWFAGGGFVVVWSAWIWSDPAEDEIFARVHAHDGTPLGPEFRVNTYSLGRQYRPAVAADEDGNFVVVWESAGQDGGGWGVFARRFDASGSPLAGEFRVNVETIGDQRSASVARRSNGDFVVVWGGGQDGSGSGIFGRRYDATGTPLTGDFRINTVTSFNQHAPEVAMDRNGAFVVVWQSAGLDVSTYGVAARRFDAAGVPEGQDLRVNAYVTSLQQIPSVASSGDGRFVVAWQSYGQDGSDWGVFARQVTPDLIFRDGFETGDLSNWTSSAVDSDDLSVSGLAASKFTAAGLQGVVNDTAALYVQDDTPLGEERYRARFHFDTNGFDPGEAAGARRVRLFVAFDAAPARRLAAIVLRRVGGAYEVMGRARLDDNTQHDTGFFPVSDGPHSIELDWRRASGPDANDGIFALWIDGAQVYTTEALDNNRGKVEYARLGALGVKPGATGTLFWDEFDSRRFRYIGP